MVLEVPPGVLGILNDAHWRWVNDLGVTGPDQGKGGKYLVVPPGYKGTLPKEGYFVQNTRTFSHNVIMRGFVQGSDAATIVKNMKANTKMYPLSAAANPPQQKFVNFSGMQINTVHANDVTFYDELNEVVQHEPDDFLESEVVGILASIGIKKGKPFAPDARMKAILTDAAAVANATSRAMTFASRDPLTTLLPRPAVDHLLHALEPRVRRWRRTNAGCAHHVLLLLHRRVADDGQPEAGPGRGLCVHRPRWQGRMARRQQELQGDAATQHSSGPVLVVQRLRQPAPLVPRDRSEDRGSRQHTSRREKNADGSVTVWFGPKAPAGQEGNWVQTWPGKGFNVIFRLYWPLQGWFDKSWKPGDFELVD